MDAPRPQAAEPVGLLAALAAFLSWGLLPLYYAWLSFVPATEIMAHRIVWSLAVTAAFVAVGRRSNEALAVLGSRRKLAIFAASSLLISVNWLLYIWSVVNGRLLEASMGYFLLPLVAVLLGAAVLRERLLPRQMAAVAIVGLGVGYMVVMHGRLPWIALTLSTTFGAYSLLRKIAPAESLVGLFVETLLLAPLAVLYLTALEMLGDGVFLEATAGTKAMLVLAGPATAGPLLLFAFAARRMRLSTLGLMQYLNPTCQMLVAVYLFGEPFSPTDRITFACIWIGLMVYSFNPGWLGPRGIAGR